MSTRCNIIIKEPYGDRYILYHHHDGYPEGVGEQLSKVLKERKFFEGRGYGHYLANDLIKNQCGLNDTEYEITSGVHGDIDYCYVVNYRTHTLRCFRTYYGDGQRFLPIRSRIVPIPEWNGGPTIYENPTNQ